MRRFVWTILIGTGALVSVQACGTDTPTDVIVPPPTTPTLEWEAIVPSNALPAEAAGRVAVPNTADFTLTGLDPETGRTLWFRALPVGTVGVTGFGDVFVANKLGAPDSTAATFIDPISGFDLWSIRLSAVQPRPVLRVGGTIVAHINDTLLVGLDRTSGIEAWRVRLGPLNCAGATYCNKLTPIGVDRGDGYILRQSSLEAQIITVRETGVTGQVVAQSAVLRRAFSASEVTAVAGTGLVAVASRGDAAGIDAGTGAERWRTTFSTLVPPSYVPEPFKPRFTLDGTLLVALLGDSTSAREVVLGMSNGQQVRQRAVPVSQIAGQNFRCGADGYASIRPNGFEYVNLRTGALSTIDRPGLVSTLSAALLDNAFETLSGYVIFSREFNRAGRHLGVRCSPA